MAKLRSGKYKSDNQKRSGENGRFRDDYGVVTKGIRAESIGIKVASGHVAKAGKLVTGKEISGVRNYKHTTMVASHNFYGGDIHAVPTSEKISIIKKGISKKELEVIKNQSDLDYETLSSILSVSKAKLHSKKGTQKFDQNTSERIMLLADVVAYGQSVFGDKDSFNQWLKASNKALGDQPPIELMDTVYGIDEVKKEIGRIEYGVF